MRIQVIVELDMADENNEHTWGDVYNSAKSFVSESLEFAMEQGVKYNDFATDSSVISVERFVVLDSDSKNLLAPEGGF